MLTRHSLPISGCLTRERSGAILERDSSLIGGEGRCCRGHTVVVPSMVWAQL